MPILIMKAYLSGGISNDPDYKKKFKKAERQVKKLGYEVVNPAEIGLEQLPGESDEKFWCRCMVECVKHLLPCDAIFMLPLWTLSIGARIERYIAGEKGKDVYYL